MNSFSKNKKIVEICKNYYKIVNSLLYEGDKITQNIIRIYEDYIFSLDIITKREVEKLQIVDKIMLKFISDSKFKKEMCEYFSNLKVSKAVNNLVEFVMNKMIAFAEEYKDFYTRNIYIPRWI
ncbi:MAG: hypothetical protein HFE04_01590 [Bacilli bacterium]|nr:hypothetical protein [Bacilli bacterium]